jgi:predicted DCC family thiol-disulfide oxidoreductase YuxK
LYEPGISYNYKSSAAIEIANDLGGFFHFGTVFKLIPNRLRNLLYDYIARNRYLWCGKKDSCLLPTEEIKSKFLE